MSVIEKIENIIKEVANEYPYKVKGNPDTYDKYNEGWSDACDVLRSKILEEAKLIEIEI